MWKEAVKELEKKTRIPDGAIWAICAAGPEMAPSCTSQLCEAMHSSQNF